ncbi:hypothetical protein [Pengzhenrongella sp.]|uniref:hypothetical protein n=1 Tax=Pengzhenrongella sp. TaxID=2888820 RepID=UPI002F939B6B
MTRDLSWLPERHLPVVAALAHADDLLGQVANLVYDFGTTPHGGLTVEMVAREGMAVAIVAGVTPLPPALSFYVADVLTTLRAAVEHTLYAEVEHANRAPLTTAEARAIEMPAFDTADKFEKWLADRKNRAPKPLQLRSSPVLTYIRALQPYQRRNSPQDHPMALLAAHTNVMKHRSPAVSALRIETGPLSPASDPRIEYFQTLGPVRVGDVLARLPIDLAAAEPEIQLNVILGVQRPGTNQWPTVILELGEIAHWVRTRAVPILITGTPDVDHLPAWYDTTVGHHDHRAAISAGTWTTAVDRHEQRILAFRLRWRLPRIILFGASPTAAATVNRWVAALDEAEVLERYERFQRCVDDEAAAYALAAQMIGEAQEFERQRAAAEPELPSLSEGAP